MNRILSLIGMVLVVGCAEPEPRDITSLTVLDDGVENGFLLGTVVSPEDREPYSGPVFSSGGVELSIVPGRSSLSALTRRTRRTYDPSWNGRLKDGLFDGPHEVYYENGQLEIKGSYSKGERDGPWEEYDDNGQLWTKTTYKDGVQDGPFEKYDENGRLSEKGTHKDGEKDRWAEYRYLGESIISNPWDEMLSFTVLDGEVVWDGPHESYYPSGQLFSRVNYTNGEFDGPFEVYYENGQLRSKTVWEDGEPVGDEPMIWYNDDGRLLDGQHELYSPSSQLQFKAIWKDGVRVDGPFEQYDFDGELFTKGTYKDGEKCGEWFEFFETVTYDPC